MQKRSLIFILILTISMTVMNLFFRPNNAKKQETQVQNELQAKNQTLEKQTTSKVQRSGENFYVLENDHQQLVFSSIGGAIAEINLPFKGNSEKENFVYPIQADQKLADQDSKHAFFPLNLAKSANKEVTPSKGGYYPLIRRSADLTESNPRYYAFNIVSDQPGLENLNYKVTHHDSEKIVFEADHNGRKITKTYTIGSEKSPYEIDLALKVDGDASNLYLTSGVLESELISNMQTPNVVLRHLKNNKFETSKHALPKKENIKSQTNPDWIANSNGFFSVIINPENQVEKGFNINKVKVDELNSRLSTVYPKIKQLDGYEVTLPIKASGQTEHYKIFAGPLEKNALLKADQVKESSQNYLGAQTYSGFLGFISEPCAKILFKIMNFFHHVTGSWGFSIILLTIFVRLLLYPLNTWSIKSMRRNQEIAPEISEIQAKYKKNPKQAQVEIMSLYRKRKVNPLSGCLPMLIQAPFLLGMFSLLRSTFVLRGVPFIKGWINNLAAPDVLFSWSHSIPFFGTQFHLLPFLSIIIFWLQQKLSSSPFPKEKSQMTDQQKQQKMLMYFLPIFMAMVCYSLPAGLNIYFIFSTLLGIVQQWITNKIMDKKSKASTMNKKKTALKESQA